MSLVSDLSCRSVQIEDGEHDSDNFEETFANKDGKFLPFSFQAATGLNASHLMRTAAIWYVPLCRTIAVRHPTLALCFHPLPLQKSSRAPRSCIAFKSSNSATRTPSISVQFPHRLTIAKIFNSQE